jgi:hypothetical protein
MGFNSAFKGLINKAGNECTNVQIAVRSRNHYCHGKPNNAFAALLRSTSSMKWQIVVTQTIRQTEIPALLDS